jgi:hypothetical protein
MVKRKGRQVAKKATPKKKVTPKMYSKKELSAMKSKKK